MDGGRTCLDFANTVGPRRPAPGTDAHDYVPDYRALAAWAAHAGALSPAQQLRLTTAAEADEPGAAAVHRAAVGLREAVHECFAALALGSPTPAAALDVIHDVYLGTLRNARLRPDPAGLGWHWPDQGPLEQVLWPIARSAVDLAVAGPLARIKECPGDDGTCGWLFVDTSKNATRRWCSMRTCGSRVKSRRQAGRLRATRAVP